MQSLLALILILPLLGGIFNALVGSRLPRRLVEAVACTVIWGACAAAAALCCRFTGPVRIEYASWLSDFDFKAPIAFYLDQLSLSLTLMITFVCGLIHLYSIGYMKDDPCHVRYFSLLNIFVFAMLMLVLAENLPLLYLGWEGVGFCSYALIGFWYREPANATAGRKAFIVTRIGDTAFGIAMVWLFQLFGTESITALNDMASRTPSWVITALGLLLLIGAAGKSAQLPLSVWLPDAMAGPTPVSAQIHAATMVTAGVYLLMRMFPLIGSSGTVMGIIAVTGGATALYGASCACVQRDLKRILAYSTISQVGYMMLAVGAGALTAATFHLLTHAFFKALLFLGAGCVITALRHQQDIFAMGGLKRHLPAVYWPFLAGSLCLAGFPGSGGFFSKDAILAGVVSRGGSLYSLLYLAGLFTALLTSFYTFRLLLIVFHGEDRLRTADAPGPGSRLPAVMTLTLLPLAAAGFFGGVINLPVWFPGNGLLGGFLGGISGFAVNGHHTPAEEAVLLALAVTAWLAGLGAAWLRYGGARRAASLAQEQDDTRFPVRFLRSGWLLDELYRIVFVIPFERMTRLLWKDVDERCIDGFLDSLARMTGRAGRLPAAWSTGRVSTALAAIAGGVAAALIYVVLRITV